MERDGQRSKLVGFTILVGIVGAALGVVLLLSDDDGQDLGPPVRKTVAEGPNQLDIRLKPRQPGDASKTRAGGSGPATALKTRRGGKLPAGGKPRQWQKAGLPGQLVGVVEDREGGPVSQATVHLRALRSRRRGQRARAPATRKIKTDALGRFKIALPPGRYMLWASAEGFADSRREWRLRIRSGQEERRKLVVRPANTLRGKVLTYEGTPIQGAVVRAIRRRGRPSAKTDAGGNFYLEGLVEGTYTVRASAKGFVTQYKRDVPLDADKGGEVVFKLVPGGRLAGVLRSPAGQVLPRGLVFAYRDEKRLGMTYSDAEGRYELSGVSAGELELFARSRDYKLTVRTQATVEAGKLTPIDLVLSKGGRIVGTVTDEAGQPLEGVTVRARAKGAGEISRRDVTDEAGSYAIENLYPGTYEVGVLPRRRRGSWGAAPLVKATVEVAKGEVKRDLRAPAGASLSGVVFGPDGKPIARAGVYAIVGKAYRGTTYTNNKGEFRLTGLKADTYRLFVRVGNDKLVAQQEITLQAGSAMEGLEVHARAPARLKGRVLDPNGNPVPGIELSVRGVGSPVHRWTKSKPDGSYELGPLYDGKYRLEARKGTLALAASKLNFKGLALEAWTFEVKLGGNLAKDLKLTEPTN